MLQKTLNRLRRKVRVRSKLSGTQERPRLSIFRSGNHIYAQIIDDVAGKTLASACDLKITTGPRVEKAMKVGEAIAKAAVAAGVTTVVFDRGGFAYHGRVKALAESARNNGLSF